MTLRVEISFGRRVVARAEATNLTAEGDVSDYAVEARSEASPVTGLGALDHVFGLVGHDRRRSAWALVAKIATELAAREDAYLPARAADQDLLEGGER